VFKIATGQAGAKPGGRDCAGVAGLACARGARRVVSEVSRRGSGAV